MLSSSRVSSCARAGASATRPFTSQRTAIRSKATVHKVEIVHEGKTYNLDVPAGETVLSVALDKYKLDLPHGACGIHRGYVVACSAETCTVLCLLILGAALVKILVPDAERHPM